MGKPVKRRGFSFEYCGNLARDRGDCKMVGLQKIREPENCEALLNF